MKTFCVQTLGCKVNQYEGEQLAALLRARGLEPAPAERADVRLVHTCSVTVQAASKSRQTVRRAVRLPVIDGTTERPPAMPLPQFTSSVQAHPSNPPGEAHRSRVIVTGCWATSDRAAAAALPGVDAVLTHRDDVAAELDRLLGEWREVAGPLPPHAAPNETDYPLKTNSPALSTEPVPNDGWINEAGAPAGQRTRVIQANSPQNVKKNPAIGMNGLPVLGEHQTHRQRAFLKVQDGCDAHCTYCIIPKLRPTLWSKPVETCVEEAKALVDAGHVEIVLTGIFLGAFGQATALRRRQMSGGVTPLARLVEALCTRVPGLRRLRLSSLEPGDLTPGLIATLRAHEQVVPHFHLPLQSGSDALLHRMNRQYMRGDFFEMIDRVNDAFDRPALTTDVIVGFPGESDDEFARTVEVVDRARFIHAHAFSYSPRPGTAAARWRGEFVHGPVVNERIAHLTSLAEDHAFSFCQRFLGETVELLIETNDAAGSTRHGRCERYFDVTIPAGDGIHTGDFVRARVVRVTRDATLAEVSR